MSVTLINQDQILGGGGGGGSVPWAYAPTYNFSLTPGGSLSSGANTITLPIVPQGVNGTDVGHYVYISGGTGNVEAVLITGGTATSGGINQTLQFTCANTHTGAWKLSSATGGIVEAATWLGANGGIILLNSGATVIYQAINLPSANFSIEGLSEAATIVQRANGNGTTTGRYPNGDLFSPTHNAGYYTDIRNLTIQNDTTAAQSTAIAVNYTLARGALTNITITGGNECVRLDGCGEFWCQGFFFSSGAHTTNVIHLTGAASAAGCSDVQFVNGQLFVSLGVGINVGAADGAMFSAIEGGGGASTTNFILCSSEAGPLYISNISFCDILIDGPGSGNYVVASLSAGTGSTGNIHLNNVRFLGGTATGVSVGSGVTPVMIVGCFFDQFVGGGGNPGAAITANGSAGYPLVVSGCIFLNNNSSATANTADISTNGMNIAVMGCMFYSPSATWNVASQGATPTFTVTGNTFSTSGYGTAAVSLVSQYSTTPTAWLVADNFGAQNTVGPWIAASSLLQNSWVAFNAGYPPPRYQLNGDGDVLLECVISGGTATDGTTLLTLPSGYRPPYLKFFSVPAYTGAAWITAQILVATSGAVEIFGASTATVLTIFIRISNF